MQARAYLLAAVLAACAAPTVTAADVSAFAEIGRTEYEEPPCGLWHQKCGGYLTDNDMQSTAWRIGAEFGKPRYGVRLSYVDLGKYGTDAYATSNEDCANFSGPNAHTYCGGQVRQYKTVGSMRGVFVSGIARTPELVFGTRLTAEVGYGRLRQAFRLRVENEHYDERLHCTGKLAAVGVERRGLTLSYQYYRSGCGGGFWGKQFPSGVNYAHVVAIGYRY